MRGVSAVCLVLLLASGTVFSDCVHKNRTPGAKNVAENINCILNDDCPDDSPSEPPGSTDDDDCECVPYYLCDNNTIIDNGKGLIDIRSAAGAVCQDPMELCCDKPSLVPRNLQGNNLRGLRNNDDATDQTPSMVCGKRNKDGVGARITGNEEGEAQFGEFPWMVALLEVENGEEKFVGGGSLIHPLVVLTAAHSVLRFQKDSSKLQIRAGEWDTQTEDEIIHYQQLPVKEVIIHERYTKASLYNDIALLVLHNEVDPLENVGMVCLPPQGAMPNSANCIATGWGKDVFGKAGCYQVFLKSILLPTVQRTQCEGMLRKTRLGKRFRLHSSFMCAGGEKGIDACVGDGGGPLVCPIPGDEDYYEQGGIIAWGIGCGEENVPGVYTDVSKFRTWVDEKFAARSLDTESYQRPIET